MKLRRKCIHREDARRTVQPRDCSETTMLFMLSILGFRLFSQATLNRRFTQYQKFQFLIRMLQPSRKYSLTTSSMYCSHRNRSAVQPAYLTILKRLGVAYCGALWLHKLKPRAGHNHCAEYGMKYVCSGIAQTS